jgi:hypothetical protein
VVEDLSRPLLGDPGRDTALDPATKLEDLLGVRERGPDDLGPAEALDMDEAIKPEPDQRLPDGRLADTEFLTRRNTSDRARP